MRVFLIFLCLLVAFQASAQQSQPSKNAQELYQEGESYYNLREYVTALKLFKESYLLSKEPALLVNIAQCHRYLKNYDEAIASFEVFLRENQDKDAVPVVEKVIAEIKAEKAAAQGTTGSLKIFSDADPCQLLLDGLVKGNTPLLVEGLKAGEYLLEARKDGYGNYQQKVQIKAGETIVVNIRFQPVPKTKEARSVSPKVPTILFGVSLGSVGLALVSGGVSLATSQKSKTLHEEGGHTFDEVNNPREAAIFFAHTADALLVTAIISAGVGYRLKQRVKPQEKEAHAAQ